MALEGTDTEFFGRPRGPGRAERARARREDRRRRRPLRSSDPAERSQAVTTLVEEGLERNATTLIEFVRDEREPPVLTAVAQAVLAAPVAAHPDRPEAKLRDWAVAEATRTGDAPPAAAVPSPPAAPVPSPPAAPVPSPPAPPAEPLVAELLPDDRWRTGAVPIGGRSPARGRLAPAPPRPRAVTPMAAPVTPPTPPPVVGGTIGNGSQTRVVGGRPEPEPEPQPEPAPVDRRAPAPAPVPVPASPPVPAPLAAPTPDPAPAAEEPDGRPSTWRVVKARPVDIVVWDAGPADPAPGEGSSQPATPVTR